MASPAGRGAQVRIDGDAQKAARGALTSSVEGNRDAKRTLEISGVVPDGTAPDGSTATGTASPDEVLAPGGVVSGGGGGGSYTLPVATSLVLGGVKEGAGTSIAAGGALSINYGTAANTAAAGNDSRITGAAQKSANLSDLANAATARTNLGLAAVAASGAYADLSGTPAAYSLPTASTSVLGGVKVDGSTVTIASGVISATGGGAPASASANQVFSGPASGGATTPAFRALVSADLPIDATSIVSASGSLAAPFTGASVATVSTTGGSTTLSAAQYRPGTIIATGALTTAPIFVVPDAGRWTVLNRTSGPGSAISQWNTADVGSGLSLSNNNLTVTSTTNNTQKLARTVSITAGLVYWEVTAGTGSINDLMVGVKSSTTTSADYVYNTGGCGWQGGGSTGNNGSSMGTWATFTTGDVICVALDCTNKRLWLRKNAGNWNNSGTANPVTNAGGVDISTIWNLNNGICAAVSEYTSGISATANFGGTAFAFAAPTGFLGVGSQGVDLTVKTAAGTGVTLAQGFGGSVVADGTNCALANNDPTQVGLGRQAAGAVLAGPASGGSALPTFRALVANDVASVSSLGTTSGTIATNASLATLFTLTLNGNGTLANPTNLKAGADYRWVVNQDATGSRTLAYGSAFKWVGGTPTLSTTASAVDMITATCPDGAALLARIEKGFA